MPNKSIDDDPEPPVVTAKYVALKACLRALEHLPREDAQRVVLSLAAFYETQEVTEQAVRAARGKA